MIYYTTGNLLESDAQALVNTVNCEGYMGKGIAYQFKMKYPLMYADYYKKCSSHELKIGTLHSFTEQGKIIINFPTKDKWRAKSKMEYVAKGLDALKAFIVENELLSVAIPPLGSGNGGLNWTEVKTLIVEKLADVSESCDIYIYEPSSCYPARPSAAPQLSLSALVLMQIKESLNADKYSRLGLQKTAFFMNLFSHYEYFHFVRDKFGPYDHSIDVICKSIKEFQLYYDVDTSEAYNILYNKIVSQSVSEKMEILTPGIKRAADFVNNLRNSHDVEGTATAMFLVCENPGLSNDDVVNGFMGWSEDKANRFTKPQIEGYVSALIGIGLVSNNLTGLYYNTDV